MSLRKVIKARASFSNAAAMKQCSCPWNILPLDLLTLVEIAGHKLAVGLDTRTV
jgi:hypothetical protein